jgi:hypothetical protein
MSVGEITARAVYGPPDWLVEHTNARDRRAFGFWTLVFAVIGTFFFGTAVLWVSILSLIALVPNISSETPVETEDEAETKKG